MSNLSIQVRLYNSDLTFRETLTMDSATPEHVKFTAELIQTENIRQHGPDNRKPLNLCNLMVRENGKLVSYRKFVK